MHSLIRRSIPRLRIINSVPRNHQIPIFHHHHQRRNFNQIVENFIQELKDEEEVGSSKGNKKQNKNNSSNDQNEGEPSKFDRFKTFLMKCLETIGITLSSVGVLGLTGFIYHRYYNIHVLNKMNQAFEIGDPASQLVMHKRTHKEDQQLQHDDDFSLDEHWVDRPQQKLLDDIIAGEIIGRYFLIIGEKGTGKTSLILEAMKKVNGFNVSIFDAHADPEIFRLRLGKALNYSFNEDYIGSLFSIRGPRDTTALLDIERAFSKLEELAIQRVNKVHKPLIMIINNAHLIK